jgi:hypothetical protein
VNGIPTEKALRANSAAIIGGVGAPAAADIPKEGKYESRIAGLESPTLGTTAG